VSLKYYCAFKGIQATSRHQARALLKNAEIDATDEEWERATCTIRRRRGARPPLAAVKVKVQPNASLYRLLVDQQRINQDKVEVWVCREEEQLGCVTTLVQDPVAEGHCLRSWTKVYDMLGVPEALQRELVLLAVMLEQPSFVPLDMLVGKLENPCLLAEVWKVKGVGSGPIHIAGNQALVTPGNRYATNEGCSVAGMESYEGRRKLGNHACLQRGVKSSIPKMHFKVGIPEWNATMKKWMQEQEGMSHECAITVQNLLEMTTEWWSRCQVRMRWEMLEQ